MGFTVDEDAGPFVVHLLSERYNAVQILQTKYFAVRTFKDDLNDIIRAFDGNQSKAAAFIGLSPSYLSQLLSGERKPRESVKVNIGLKRLQAERADSPSELPPASNSQIADEANYWPVISMARAGLLMDIRHDYEDLETQIRERVPTFERDQNGFALIVEGDSMLPDIRPGDRVCIAPNQEVRNGDIVCARLTDEKGGSVFLKRFRQHGRNGEDVTLESINPDYDPMHFKFEDFRFIYPAVDVIRKIRRL